MISPEEANIRIISDIKDAINEVSKKIAEIIMRKYDNEIPKYLGDRPVLNYNVVESKTNEIISILFLSEGQKALIAEYGKGSEMEKTTEGNPSISEYLNGEVFNRDRLKFNYETVSRVKTTNADEYYLDLDNKLHKKRAKHLYSRETGKDLSGKVINENVNKRYKPFSPKHIIRETIFEHLNDIKKSIVASVATKTALRDLFDGYVITGKV